MLKLRSFSTAFKPLARKQSPFTNFNSLTGNLNIDGLHRYELDFYETVEWTAALIQKMKHDSISNKNSLSDPLNTNLPLCFQYSKTYIYDATVPPPLNNNVILHVKVNQLNISDVTRHNILLIAAEKYNPITDVITLKPQDTTDAPMENASLQDNINHLSKTFNDLLQQAELAKDSFIDVPLDLSHVSIKQNHAFPKEWLLNKSESV